MTKGKVVLVPFPFDDLSATKVRPAICLTEPIGPHQHVILAFITSRIPAAILDTDLILHANHPDFASTSFPRKDTMERKLAAILSADVKDYSRLMGRRRPSAAICKLTGRAVGYQPALPLNDAMAASAWGSRNVISS